MGNKTGKMKVKNGAEAEAGAEGGAEVEVGTADPKTNTEKVEANADGDKGKEAPVEPAEEAAKTEKETKAENDGDAATNDKSIEKVAESNDANVEKVEETGADYDVNDIEEALGKSKLDESKTDTTVDSVEEKIETKDTSGESNQTATEESLGTVEEPKAADDAKSAADESVEKSVPVETSENDNIKTENKTDVIESSEKDVVSPPAVIDDKAEQNEESKTEENVNSENSEDKSQEKGEETTQKDESMEEETTKPADEEQQKEETKEEESKEEPKAEVSVSDTPVSEPNDEKQVESNIAEEKVATAFRWEGDAETVQVSGSFNNWEEKIALEKKDSVFSVSIDLLPGEYTYKYYVNGEWAINKDQQTKTDDSGSENNVITVTKG